MTNKEMRNELWVSISDSYLKNNATSQTLKLPNIDHSGRELLRQALIYFQDKGYIKCNFTFGMCTYTLTTSGIDLIDGEPENEVDESKKPYNSEKLYNLLISGEDCAWENNSYIFDPTRCIVEHTGKDLIERYARLGKDEINEIKTFPCIFAYEDYCKRDAFLGFIKDITVRQVGVKITFEKIESISLESLHKLQFELDISDWEFNRTHWAIKKVNLIKNYDN